MSDGLGRADKALIAALLVVVVAVTGGCRSRASALAKLTGTRGAVEVEHGAKGQWTTAVAGQALATGDALRTGAGAEARLRFNSGREVVLRERSVLRLGLDADSSVHVTIELGEATIDGDGDLQVDTAHGPARLGAGTRMRVRVDEQLARYEVVVGKAVLGEGSGALILRAGDGLRLRIGEAQMERYRVEVGEAEMEATPPPGQGVFPGGDTVEGQASADGGAEAGATPGSGPGTTTRAAVPRPTGPVDVSLPAGESAVLHGVQPPVAIRLRLANGCTPGPALLWREGPGAPRRKQPVGHGEARFTLAAGIHRYRVECAGAPSVSGRLEVKRDAGRSRLARRAPMNLIDADGRRYTVLYQNRLPSLTLRWPDAPAADAYTLHVAGRGDERQYPATRAQLHLASGALPEGAHSLWFTADGAAAQSPRTAVTIRFDNAAVTAEIDSPRDGVTVTDDSVEIAGVALLGSTVAVGQAPLTIDDQGRFTGQAPRPRGEERSIAIRFQHPRGGVHYYIRRIPPGR